jgi:hypothetical protein
MYCQRCDEEFQDFQSICPNCFSELLSKTPPGKGKKKGDGIEGALSAFLKEMPADIDGTLAALSKEMPADIDSTIAALSKEMPTDIDSTIATLTKDLPTLTTEIGSLKEELQALDTQALKDGAVTEAGKLLSMSPEERKAEIERLKLKTRDSLKKEGEALSTALRKDVQAKKDQVIEKYSRKPLPQDESSPYVKRRPPHSPQQPQMPGQEPQYGRRPLSQEESPYGRRATAVSEPPQLGIQKPAKVSLPGDLKNLDYNVDMSDPAAVQRGCLAIVAAFLSICFPGIGQLLSKSYARFLMYSVLAIIFWSMNNRQLYILLTIISTVDAFVSVISKKR